MRAIQVQRFGEPDVMQMVDVDYLDIGPTEVLVRIYAVGINPVECYIRSGTYGSLPELPYTPGSDAAGVVEAVGEDVVDFQPGDRVYCAGTLSVSYAEYAVCDSSQIFFLPEHLSYAQGAALGVPYATAYRALHQRAQARPGEIVLIHGASGGVGLACVQLARAAGMFVFGTAGTERGREVVLANGAHGAFDHNDPDHFDEFIDTTNGYGADVILEMLANVNLEGDLKSLALFGRVVIIGSRGRIEIDPRDAMRRDADIRGMVLFNASDSELYRIHMALGAGLANGSLNPVVSQEFAFDDVAAAHEAVMSPGTVGKLVLVIDHEESNETVEEA
jgi:NADPH:quinone reductase